MNGGIVSTTHDLLITAIDLTRSCCAHENYLATAAIGFEEQAHPTVFADFEAFDARDNLADILMASRPLTSDGLRTAVANAIHEARSEEVPA